MVCEVLKPHRINVAATTQTFSFYDNTNRFTIKVIPGKVSYKDCPAEN